MVIGIAIFASFGGVCLFAFAGNDEKALFWATGLCALAVAAIVLIVVLIAWIYRRYRREMDRD